MSAAKAAGAAFVLISSLAAAAGAIVGAAISLVVPRGTMPTVNTGLGDEIDELATKSPTLTKNIAELQAEGWKIEYGPAGKGSFADRKAKKIVIDANKRNNPEAAVQALAHETGHAQYTPDPYVDFAGLSKGEYVKKNVKGNLKDEGEATITNIEVRDEIKRAGGPDIGVAGAQSSEYEKLYKENPDPKDRDKLREKIGDEFASGEKTSTTGQTYGEYYGKPYEKHYDTYAPTE